MARTAVRIARLRGIVLRSEEMLSESSLQYKGLFCLFFSRHSAIRLGIMAPLFPAMCEVTLRLACDLILTVEIGTTE